MLEYKSHVGASNGKIAPDLSLDELDEILTAVQDNRIDAIIATNTTIGRDGLRSPNQQETGA